NGQQYDYLYCAGLFDYLPDWVCKQLMAIFYDMLAPGGLVVATNVDKCNPIRHMLDYVLEWHLIYRNARQLRALVPAAARAEDTRVSADPTGINLCLEVRRPAA
ncbi:MAG TPA: class I SAM-dependent methyltransferase, partial [Candidatus Binatia bacterium]|nr:class I SAM-dependent methyltransferase [Candidatus Binatia bacterium]